MRELEVKLGDNLETIVSALLEAKANGESVFCSFNGYLLYFDTVTMDSVFFEIVKKTEVEFDIEFQKYVKMLKMKHLSQKSLQEIYTDCIQRGNKILFSERRSEWEKCVLARIQDGYQGKELYCALDIMEALENGVTIAEAYRLLESYDLPQHLFYIIRNIVFHFSSRGHEFMEADLVEEMTAEMKYKIVLKRLENEELRKINEDKIKRKK